MGEPKKTGLQISYIPKEK